MGFDSEQGNSQTRCRSLNPWVSVRRGAPGAFCLPPQSSWPPDCSSYPILAGPAGAHIHGQMLAGAALASYASVKWLTRYFETRTLIPFAICCLLAGVVCIIRFA